MPWVAPLDNAAAAQIVCRFYQYGTCRFGSTCRFIHPAAEPATLGSSCSSSSSSSSSTTSGSSYHTGNSISDGSSPADSAPVPKASAGAAAPNTEQSSHTGAVDLSRWIDAPVFVPKAKLPLEQPPQPPQQQQQQQPPPRKSKRKSDRRTVVVDGPQQQLRRTAMDKLQQQQQQQAEQEVEDTEEKPDENGPDNEADNEADNEEEEDEEQEEEEEEVEEEENDDGGAVGGLAAAAGSPLLSYANVVTMNNNHNGTEPEVGPAGEARLCAHYEKHGLCPLADCVHVHGELCELCQRYCLDPRDREQQRRHNADCIREHELEMEHAFAVQRSRDKSCGICLDVVMEKRAREQRFSPPASEKHQLGTS
uniref:RING-type E3 ubiquitin transferase n=1 Tax=Anopheles quadriannulatus TaxID=34691 RepID=A0A182WW97_ANOQN